VSAFEIEYALDHPRHIPVEELLDLEVGLRSTTEAYVAPRPVDRTVRMRLSTLPRNATFSVTALQHVTQHLVSTFNRAGYNGVIVTVPEIEEGSGRDLRPPERTALKLRIWTGRVSRVTTMADGERFQALTVDARTDNAAHDWIRERSPVRPGGDRGLLDVAALEDYADELSRHPGRNVSVELAPGPRPGTTDVNLRVVESKPWYAYAQYANTGTDATTKNRERFGFVHNQLFDRDDILTVDYVTGDFDSLHSALIGYESPFALSAPDLRFRLRGWYSEYDASEVGFSDGRFVGEQAVGAAELVYNAWQRQQLFLDVTAGARVQYMFVENFQFDDTARATYVVPDVGLEVERNTRTSTLRFGLHVDVGLTNESRDDLLVLGNQDPDTDFAVLRWNGSGSFFLEPLIDRQAWEDPSTPASSTLAHEIALAFRGQYAFGFRLVPQFQRIAGGLNTVRGYRQADVAGDNLYLGSLEYRLHVPRLFRPDATPPEVPGMGAFRTRPPHVWGQPDWDLIVRVFSDAAHVTASDANATEPDETLWSVGGGLELQVLRNLTLRVDAGHTLLSTEDTDSGDTRVHFVGTVLY
jgi:hemolysin activation/secretion protein